MNRYLNVTLTASEAKFLELTLTGALEEGVESPYRERAYRRIIDQIRAAETRRRAGASEVSRKELARRREARERS